MFVYFNEAFVFGGFDLGFIILLLLFLLGSFRFVIKSSLLASLLDLGCFVQDLLHAVFFGFEIILTLCRYFLLSQHLVVLKTLSKLCDRHLIKEAIAGSLSRIESLGADDGHAFKFTYLSDEFFLLFLEFLGEHAARALVQHARDERGYAILALRILRAAATE